MKTTSKAPAYPHLCDQPTYREASSKLAHFRAQLQTEKEKLRELQADYAKSLNPDENGPEAESDRAIQKAEAMIAGTGSLQSLGEQIETKKRLIVALEAAATAQSTIVTQVERTLSTEAGQHHVDEHKAAVKRIAAAVQELHDANLAEIAMRSALERQGYYGALRAMPFDQQTETDPENRLGCRAYYWMNEAREYLA